MNSIRTFDTFNYPRLLYIANVPVERSYHGSALLYRLLQDYPADRLLILEPSTHPSLPERRLPGVRYETIPTGFERITRTRFAEIQASYLFSLSPNWVSVADAKLLEFKPEAVLTVGHGYLWRTADAFSRKHSIPLHIICHDEITRAVMLPKSRLPELESLFAEVYHHASSRFAVSPYMRDDYRGRFGAESTVLYPSRAPDVPQFDEPAPHLNEPMESLRVAFAGTINSAGHAALLKQLSETLARRGGRLQIFGPISPETAAAAGLTGPAIELRGLLPSNELIKTLRTESDLLFVPMSFELSDRHAMATNFPSKLTDYTAVGLPILIQGPEESSAVKWANENQDAALIVTDPDARKLSIVLERLLESSEERIILGSSALRIGTRYFGFMEASKIFISSIMFTQGCNSSSSPQKIED